MKLLKTKSFELATISAGDETASKFALVLPGLLDTKDHAHMQGHVEFLAMQGYFALSFDPPGTWQSPGSIDLYTATNYLQAIHELITFFGNRPTFAMGHSRGATMSIAAGLTNPYIFASAAIMPSHIRGDYLGTQNDQWLQQGYRDERRDLPPGGGEKLKQFKLPYSFFEDQITYNYTDQLRDSEKPKLFIYGNRDTAATPDRVKQIFDIAGKPKELICLDSDHNYRHHPTLINQVNKHIADFLGSAKP